MALPELRKFQVIETIDLRTNVKSYKVFRRGTAGKGPPIAVGFATPDEARAKIRELEMEEAKEAKRR